MTIESELRAIAQQLDKEGDTKEIRKTFWRIVGKIKRLDAIDVTDEIIEKTAHIRNRLFKHNVVLSVNKGLGLFFFVVLFALIGFIWTLLFFETILVVFITLPPFLTLITLNGLVLVLIIFIAYGAYPWGRYLGGVIARVNFDGFYRYSPGELGLKIDYKSYLRTTRSRRKWVFGFPIIWIFGIFLILLPIAWFLNPAGIWTPLLLVLLFGVFYMVIYYKRVGELYRFVRELRIEREVNRSRE
ncbi:MAG: hypothetical protein Q6364_08610 [Candidatus Hermodarchaeota archaeon]|nr:hypothetical protein [Candidatus Hermodarchaeota archaeon]